MHNPAKPQQFVFQEEEGELMPNSPRIPRDRLDWPVFWAVIALALGLCWEWWLMLLSVEQILRSAVDRALS